MFKQLSWLPFLLIGSAVALGCSSENPEEDSCNIKTAGIYVEYDVTLAGNTATAQATFWTGDKAGGTYLTFGDCGDTVTVNGQNMVRKSNSDHEWYEATITPASSYEFVFTRPDEDPYSSTVSTPPAVNVSAPAGGASISRADAFDITWEANSSGAIDLLMEGDCIKDYPSIDGEAIADTGTYTVNAGEIEPVTSGDAEKSCSVNLSLQRGADGALSPSLKGTIKAYSVGGTTFTSTP